MHNKDKFIVEKLYGKPLKKNFKFDYYPMDHSLDKKQIKKFIQASDISVRDIVKKIFDNTIHISYEKFINRLNLNIYHLLSILDVNRPLFIYLSDINNINNKSNYWLYLYLQNFIDYITNNSKSIILINDSNLKLLIKNDIIIFIDDCIYSGYQMSEETIQTINYDFKESYRFYLLVPFISKFGLENIKDFFKANIKLKQSSLIISPYQFYIPIINDILTEEEINIMQYYYDAFYLDFDNRYLIYFDHKLADRISTITDFYLGVVPCTQNVKISHIFENFIFKHGIRVFNNIEEMDIFDYIYDKKYNVKFNDLIIIPVIKNCSSVIKIKSMSPLCPIPPYKPYFKNLIKFLKDNNHLKTKSLSLSKKNRNIKPFLSL